MNCVIHKYINLEFFDMKNSKFVVTRNSWTTPRPNLNHLLENR